LADQVGGCTAALTPLFKRIEAYVLSTGTEVSPNVGFQNSLIRRV
jgi:hypothetical protein